MIKKSGLGKGLSALIPVTAEKETYSGQYKELEIGQIDPNPDQPRRVFDDGAMAELAESIKHNGVIQPIIVTKKGSRYLVIAGERRWRATKLAGYDRIPAVIRTVEKGQMLALALLENIQRQELNPIEEALAYRKLVDTHHFTHETLAKHLGKNRVTISNTLRLLRLPERIQDLVQDGALSFGHARCLITLEDEPLIDSLAQLCVQKQWSVRELERRVQLEKERGKVHPKKAKNKEFKSTEKKLSGVLKSRVSISGDGKRGKIMISYASEKDYQYIIDILENGAGRG